MTQRITDLVPSMNISEDAGLMKMNGSYVVDVIRAGYNKFFQPAKRTHTKFNTNGNKNQK